MKSTYVIALAVVVLVIIIGGVLAYAYLGRSSTSTSTPTLAAATINGAGGTLVYPLMSVWQSAYGLAEPQIQVNYNPSGSGLGITYFTEQLEDFGESDAPMTATQYAALPSGTTALTIPVSASAVVPAYNILLTNGSYCQNGLNFTGAVLANIFLGTITKWNDPQIQSLQSPNVASVLPDQTIITVHRSDGSGTMFAFTDYLSQASSTWASQVGKGTAVDWPKDNGNAIGALHNSGVAETIIENDYSIGPLEIAYELENSGQISYGAVQNAAGNYILANVTNVAASLQAGASAGLPAGNAEWSNVSIVDNIYNDAVATTAYPIATLTYALVYQEQNYNHRSYAESAATVNFISWIVNTGQTFGPRLGYVSLPANIVAVDNTTIKLITYNGTPIQS